MPASLKFPHIRKKPSDKSYGKNALKAFALRSYNSFKAAFSLFSRLPMPKADWTKEGSPYILTFFPLVGGLFGLILFFLGTELAGSGANASFAGACLALSPVLFFGDIHLAGFLHNANSLAGQGDREERLRLLNEKRVSPLPVFALGCHLLLFFGSCCQIYGSSRALAVLCLAFALSRTISGIGILTGPLLRQGGWAESLKDVTPELPVRSILGILAVLLCALMLYADILTGLCTAAGMVLLYLNTRRLSLKYHGGLTKEATGFYICLSETAAAAIIAFCVVFMKYTSYT